MLHCKFPMFHHLQWYLEWKTFKPYSDEWGCYIINLSLHHCTNDISWKKVPHVFRNSSASVRWYDACMYCDEKFKSRTGNRHLRNTRDFDKVQIVSLTYRKKIGSCYIWIYVCVCKQIVCLYVILPQTRGCRSTNVFPVQDSLWQCCQYNQRLNELQFAAFIESHQPIPFSDPVTQPRSPLAAVCQLSSAFRGPGNFCGHTTVKSGDQY